MPKITALTGKLNYYFALLLAFNLSLQDRWLILVFFCWVATWIIDVVLSKRYLEFRFDKQHWVIYILWAYALLMLISVFYSQNLEYAYKIIERRVVIAIVPLMLSIGFSKEYKLKPLLLAFVAGNVFSLLFSLGIPVIEYLSDFKSRNMIHKYPWKAFLQFFLEFKHRTYFGINQMLALLSLLYLRKDLIPKIGKLCYWLCFTIYALVYTSLMLVLGGRIALIILVLVASFYVFNALNNHQHRKFALTVMLLGVLSMIALYAYHPRFESIRPGKLTENSSLQSKDSRLGIWYSGLQVLGEDKQYMLGVGIGDVKDLLKEKYIQNRLSTQLVESNSHVHNTYLQVLLETGIPGLLCLLMLLIAFPLSLRDKKERLYAGTISFMFAMLMMVEVVFLQIGGLLVFSLSFLFLSKTRSRKEEYLSLPDGLCKTAMLVNVAMVLMALVVFSYPLYGKQGYDPKDPGTYATNNYELIKQLPGNPPEELQGCWGYKISSTCIGYYQPQYDRIEFLTGFYQPGPGEGKFSTWCYVSEDFDGVHVQIFTNSSTGQNFSDAYDLSQKGSWQKLSFNYSGLDKLSPFSFFFAKEHVKDFSTLKGYAVFALPFFE
ncbi:MAG: O-antigen ligase family protein [Bacteroidales bacterium]|nr:O-antigen ligase family protein [Bacteroidales bacterium]